MEKEQATATRDQLRFHPVAEIFPLMAGAEFDALVEDIREHGLHEPIVVVGDAILDGRNRWRACQTIGLEPQTVEWSGDGSALDFVLSRNLHRRHLNVSQRALIAARMANMRREDTLIPDAAHRRLLEVSIDPSSETLVSAEQAADRMSVSRPSVFRAKRVLENGTPEEVQAIEEGRITINAVHQKIRGGQRKQMKPAAVVTHSPHRVHRGRPKLPEGMSPEATARKAIELRERFGSIGKAAAQLGLGRGLCQQMMDIVLIADREDLSERDAAFAAAALRQMNENNVPIEALCESIQPIAVRLWGTQRGGRRSRESLEFARMDRFLNFIAFLTQSCKNGGRIEIPHLSPQQTKEVEADLRQAISEVRQLLEKVVRIHR
jgi:hypothetical protein